MTPRSTPSIPVGPGTRWDCIHPEEARRTNVIEEPTIYEVCSRCEAVLAIRQEARPTPVEPEARPDWWTRIGEWAHDNAIYTKDRPDTVEVPALQSFLDDLLAESGRLAVEPDGLPLDVLRERLDSLIWNAIGENEGCAHHYGNLTYSCSCAVPVEALRAALDRLGPSEDEQPR